MIIARLIIMRPSPNYFGIDLSDLEKAASGASIDCRQFVRNHAFLRTFLVKYPVLLSEDGGRRVDDGELRFDKGDLR